MSRLQRQPQIFVDGKTAKQIGDLERPRKAAMADAVRRDVLDLAAVETDGAGIGREQTGYQVEQRGLPGAVRPDQSVDFAGARCGGLRW